MIAPVRPHAHEFEAAYGLPEPLPPDERLLWQGAPAVRGVALHVFHVRKVAVYFAVLLALRGAFVGSEAGAWAAVQAMLWLAPVFAIGLALLLLLARMTAMSAAYSITDRRVVMRIGIVLTVTFNLPLRRIESAGVHAGRDGSGDIALRLAPGDRIAYLHLWPHARPWRLARTEPALRCLTDVQAVGRILSAAWQAVQPRDDAVEDGSAAATSTVPRPVAAPAPADARRDLGAALATH